MKKITVLFFVPLITISCNSSKHINVEECLERINNTISKYEGYTNLDKDFIFINNTTNEKEELVASNQFGYDSENKLLYRYNLEENYKKWYYFEDKVLFELTQQGESKTKTNKGEQEIVGENYFKKFFADYLIEIMYEIKSYIKNESFSSEEFYATSDKNYSIIFSNSDSSQTYIFKNLLLVEYEIKNFNLGSTLNKETLKIEYKKFTTSVNKDEFK